MNRREYQALVEKLQTQVNDLQQAQYRYDTLVDAIDELYQATEWIPTGECEAESLWANVLEAAGLEEKEREVYIGNFDDEEE
jgi:uncharacterized protein YoxC